MRNAEIRTQHFKVNVRATLPLPPRSSRVTDGKAKGCRLLKRATGHGLGWHHTTAALASYHCSVGMDHCSVGMAPLQCWHRTTAVLASHHCSSHFDRKHSTAILLLTTSKKIYTAFNAASPHPYFSPPPSPSQLTKLSTSPPPQEILLKVMPFEFAGR